VKLYIWDTAGQEQYRAIVSSYFNGCQGVIMVFDINKATTFHSAINKWYEMARAKCPDASFMLIANKIDLSCNIDESEATRWTKMNNVLFMKTSVKEGINVQMCFEKLA
jgi:small GTP-binding protein